ncbi:unnamed protein product [Pleuronectes platessa]|uniref:Uncharacterized protein n=1 Tax=Pleuronectes platessa TaxID=8262 RepID=A0A9N7UIK0_PLEPL|nr:unnamed protein product [Pleuronectes platessa]
MQHRVLAAIRAGGFPVLLNYEGLLVCCVLSSSSEAAAAPYVFSLIELFPGPVEAGSARRSPLIFLNDVASVSVKVAAAAARRGLLELTSQRDKQSSLLDTDGGAITSTPPKNTVEKREELRGKSKCVVECPACQRKHIGGNWQSSFCRILREREQQKVGLAVDGALRSHLSSFPRAAKIRHRAISPECSAGAVGASGARFACSLGRWKETASGGLPGSRLDRDGSADAYGYNTRLCAARFAIYNEKKSQFEIKRNNPKDLVERVARDISKLLNSKRKALEKLAREAEQLQKEHVWQDGVTENAISYYDSKADSDYSEACGLSDAASSTEDTRVSGGTSSRLAATFSFSSGHVPLTALARLID